MNSYKRQALGCMFGMNHMPSMCSTYPMARELSWADFWHEYPVRGGSMHVVAWLVGCLTTGMVHLVLVAVITRSCLRQGLSHTELQCLCWRWRWRWCRS